MNKCYCVDISFEEIAKKALENNITYDEEGKNCGAFNYCGFCKKYFLDFCKKNQTNLSPNYNKIKYKNKEK